MMTLTLSLRRLARARAREERRSRSKWPRPLAKKRYATQPTMYRSLSAHSPIFTSTRRSIAVWRVECVKSDVGMSDGGWVAVARWMGSDGYEVKR